MKKSTQSPDILVKVKLGKTEFYQFSMVDILHATLGKSKSELKRLFKAKAIDIYYEKT